MQFVADPEFIDVRKESWYPALLQSTSDQVNTTVFKTSFQENRGEILLVGIEGDVEHGKRTKYEWLALLEDIDRGVTKGVVKLRPKSRRVTLEDFEEEVADWATRKGKHRVVIICSCPCRLGDDLTIMEQVETLAAGYDNIRCCWSRAGNLADVIFEPGVVARGGGAADLHSDGTAATRSAVCIGSWAPSRVCPPNRCTCIELFRVQAWRVPDLVC
eukprot:SAG11_NODE_6595_length_1281_cov_5.369712_1_plen_216_part_00